jgi:AraC family transcriptional regulator, transcriptional activator of pobA
MLTPSPKSFDYHNFLRDVLRQSDSREYFLAEHTALAKGMVNVPYRNYFYGIGLATEGCRRLRVGFDTYDFKAGTLLTIGPSILRQWLDLSQPFQSDTIFFSSELFQNPINPHFLSEMSIFKTGISHVLPLSEDEVQGVSRLFHCLKQYKNQSRIVAAQTLTLIEMVEHFHQNSHQTVASLSRQETLLCDFDALLQKHYLENKDVAFYAQKLNLTPNHLSETLKSLTGKSAKKRIEDALIFEAKSLLRQTTMSIKEITYWLGFEDDSYFVKFFKQAEGVTPNVYRSDKTQNA